MMNDNYPTPIAVPVQDTTSQSNTSAWTAPSLASTKQQSKSFKIQRSTPHLLAKQQLDGDQTNTLLQQGFTQGLTETLNSNSIAFALRFWVVDNSGSMAAADGKRYIPLGKKQNDYKMVSCTRWREIQETVEYHVQMAALLKAPTVFRLLNDPGLSVGPQEFGVANKGDHLISQDVQVALQTTMNASPRGVTPLSSHIHDIREQIQMISHELYEDGRRVAIVLATDGLPTDSQGIAGYQQKTDFIQALKTLEGLPIWIVVRLCTDSDEVVDFYNSLDSQLELSVDVLDDLQGEALEVQKCNPWLNYTLQLHRIREMGCSHRLFDLLDERLFTVGELRDFCVLLFGKNNMDGVADPAVDFKGFVQSLEVLLKKEKKQYNPVEKRLTDVIDLKKIYKLYGGSSCCIM